LLYVVLSKFAWGPILEALEAREHAVDDNLAAAQRAHEQAKMLLADYERRLAQAHEEVRGILEAARRDAEHQKQGIVAEARSAALAERERALGDIDQAAGRAINDLAERSAALAIDLAGRIVRGPLAPLDQAALAREALGELAAIRPRNH
jgi:F-type H+-transporting ATPase subunit b